MLTLLTRDGTKVGNAILIGMVDELSESFLVETDFGNKMKLNRREIDELYMLGRCTEYSTWRADREELQQLRE